MQRHNSSKYAPVVILVLAGVLLLPLFPIPAPANVSSIPWKVELAFSLVLIAVAAYSGNTSSALFRYERHTAVIILGFVAWSALSMLWARSWFAAMHHTLVWANYLAIILLTGNVLRAWGGLGLSLRLFGLIAAVLASLCIFDLVMLVDFAVQEGAIRIRYAKYAEMLVVAAPVLFGGALYARTKRDLAIALIPAALAWLVVMLSLSKGAFISGIFGFLLLFALIAIFSAAFRRRAAVTFAAWVILTVAVQAGFALFSSVPATADYIAGESDETRSTTNMRIYTWKIAGEMARSSPILGVGADNFGISVNVARRDHAIRNPSDPDSAIGEDYIFERAHNEPLQVLTELGVMGFAIVAALALFVGYTFVTAIWRTRGRVSPVLIASFAGTLSFAVSSLFSSFSFRAYQNGIVFAITLAIGLNEVRKASRRKPSAAFFFSFRTFAVIVAAMLAIYSAAKGTSQFATYFAANEPDLQTAKRHLSLAKAADPDNGAPYLAHAERLVAAERFDESIQHFRNAIARGLGVSVVYSYLANAEEKAARLRDAKATLQEAVAIFPRSAFLRARLAVVLEKLGEFAEAEQQLAVARAFNTKQTNGWYAVIKHGILEAHIAAQNDPEIAPPPALEPNNAIYFYADEPIGPATPE